MSNFSFSHHEYSLGEPITALATPYGKSAICVIRLSGDQIIERFKPLFSRPKALDTHAKMSYGFIIDPQSKKSLDEVMVTPFYAPHSYTGEESIEIDAHGNMKIAEEILLLLHQHGFRMALPGEFTYRSFLLGKMDLTQAEAVHELIDAKTSRSAQAALGRLEGHLSQKITALYNKTIDILAPLNSHLDYPEEELEELPIFNVDKELAELERLVSSSLQSRLLQDGATVVIAGIPNVGKSSLFNALLQQDRAIVSPIAGATRDYLESSVELSGIALKLIDTAGLRETTDPLEQIGVGKSRELLEKADVILYLVDASEPVITEDIDAFSAKTILIANKSDQAQAPDKFLPISVLERQGFDQLEEKIKKLLHLDQISQRQQDYLLGNVRQQQLCEEAYQAFQCFHTLIQEGTVDELAYQMKRASHALAQLLGRDSDRESIEAMFSRFCLGK